MHATSTVPVGENSLKNLEFILADRQDDPLGAPLESKSLLPSNEQAVAAVDPAKPPQEETAAPTEPIAIREEQVELAVGDGAEDIFQSAGSRQEPSRSKGGPVIIVLVNPKSGGNTAGVLLKLPRDGLLVEVAGGGGRATVFSYPIMDPAKEGIRHLAAEVHAASEQAPIRCIVAGGDGTVMWAIQEIMEANIPTNQVLVGTIPFGTGNDFGNVTRWGTSGPSRGFLKEEAGFAGLQGYVASWLRADASPFDIWEFSVLTRPSQNARFEFIEKGKKVCTEKHMARHGIKHLGDGQLEMSKYVCNYVGMGLDARVGFGFDKLRQQNRAMNKAVYVWEGVKKLLFKKKGVIAHIIDSMRVQPSSPIASARELHSVEEPTSPDAQVVFSTASAASSSPDAPRLLGNPVSLLFLNIPSISGGLDIWRWSARKLGTSKADKSLLAARQDFGDGRLECLSYRTGAGFYLEQARAPPISGQGHRIFSGGGPLHVKFRSPTDPEYIKGTAHCKGRTYMQVDGEFFAVHEPQSVVIKHHATIGVIVNSDAKACC